MKGKFTYTGVTHAASRYYSVAVGYDNMPGVTITNPVLLGAIARTETGVLRNLQYDVNLTVKGPGWETPFGPDAKDNTALDVKVEVVPFGQVSQDVEIE